MSRGKARETDHTQATADLVIYLLSAPPSLHRDVVKEWEKARVKYAPQACDTAAAEAALTYAREVLGEQDERNDYEHNLYLGCVLPFVTRKTAGIVASVIQFHRKVVEKQTAAEAEAKLAAGSTHFGEVGQRLDFYVKLLNVFTSEGFYGTTYIHKMATSEGNAVIWFASSNPGMEQGVAYKVSATIKEHGVRYGVKQTVVSRVVVWTEEGVLTDNLKQAKKALRLAKKEKRTADLAGLQAAVDAAQAALDRFNAPEPTPDPPAPTPAPEPPQAPELPSETFWTMVGLPCPTDTKLVEAFWKGFNSAVRCNSSDGARRSEQVPELVRAIADFPVSMSDLRYEVAGMTAYHNHQDSK